LVLTAKGPSPYAFAAVAAAIVSATGSLFTALFPDVLRSSTSPAYTLTVGNASSTAKTLALMTVIACIFLPLVLLYQAWTYWVFRKRISVPRSPATAPQEVPPAASGPVTGAAPPAGQQPAPEPRAIRALRADDIAVSQPGRPRPAPDGVCLLVSRLERLAPAGLAAFRSGDLLSRLVTDIDSLADSRWPGYFSRTSRSSSWTSPPSISTTAPPAS
jgi:Cytochrome bd terminal oxidase subunit II